MRYSSSVFSSGLLLAAVVAGAAAMPGQQAKPQFGPGLSGEQIQALVTRALVNQHKSDAAFDEYERTERVVTRGRDGTTHEVVSRVVPNGSGEYRVALERDGRPTDAASLNLQWHNVAQALTDYTDADNPRVKADRERAAKRNRERDHLEDAVPMAFRFHWVKETTKGDRTLVELFFEPDPDYKPTVLFGNLLQHLRGTAWLDKDTGQLVSVQAQLFEDVSFYGGIVAKLYKGANVTIENGEVMPGVWLPTRFDADIDGRKFVLGTLSMHEQIEINMHRRVGPPQQALAIVRHDHPAAVAVDP